MEPNFDIIKECEKAKRILVTGHIKPDGDCIGSTVAMTMYLRKKLPKADVRLLLEQPSPAFMYLSGIDVIESGFAGWKDGTDVCIVIDTSADRSGNAEKFFKEAKKTINIDHHISNADGCGMLNFIDPTASSASELVYQMIDKEDMDDEMAKFIYLGITHDTGVFRYPNTAPSTFKAAADLITYDFDFSDLVEKTFYEKSFEQKITAAGIVKQAKRYFDGRVIFGSISYKDFCEGKMTSNSFDGTIEELRVIRGCECAIFMYPINEKTNKVSMRSLGSVDVSKITAIFGGGGHVRAAGMVKDIPQEELTERILDAIAEQTGWER